VCIAQGGVSVDSYLSSPSESELSGGYFTRFLCPDRCSLTTPKARIKLTQEHPQNVPPATVVHILSKRSRAIVFESTGDSKTGSSNQQNLRVGLFVITVTNLNPPPKFFSVLVLLQESMSQTVNVL
jgi:hypothetical protein